MMVGVRNFLSNRLTWFMAVFVVGYIFFSHMVSVSENAEFARTVNTTFAFMAVFGFIGAAIKAFKAHRWPNPDLIAALALVAIGLKDALGGLFQVLWRGSNFEFWVVNNRLYSFTVLLGSVGWFFLIVTPNLVGKDVPKWDRARLILSWSVAAAVIIGLVVASPDLSGLARAIRPYISAE